MNKVPNYPSLPWFYLHQELITQYPKDEPCIKLWFSEINYHVHPHVCSHFLPHVLILDPYYSLVPSYSARSMFMFDHFSSFSTPPPVGRIISRLPSYTYSSCVTSPCLPILTIYPIVRIISRPYSSKYSISVPLTCLIFWTIDLIGGPI